MIGGEDSMTLRSILFSGATAVVLACSAAAQTAPAKAAGGDRGFIATPVFTQEDDDRILKLYEGLRVADVADGLDMVGLPDVTLMNPEIRPLWRDTDNFSHMFIGIAVTARYVPTNRPRPKLSMEEFPKWESNWYREISPEPFVPLLRRGSALVLDATEDGDTGSIGSNNIMAWKIRGMVGVVTSGGARDSDEIIKEKVPLYYRRPTRGIRPGRNEIESVNRPITCGGVLVRPGDVIVADGDGVAVVPREHAEAVAKAARVILDNDKAGRRKLYEKLGLPADRTVKD
jgi:4-hydroxy-4-methyl-2-oxoglutarate aldolase